MESEEWWEAWRVSEVEIMFVVRNGCAMDHMACAPRFACWSPACTMTEFGGGAFGKWLVSDDIMRVGPSWRGWCPLTCLWCRRPGFDPWVGKFLWRREWQSTPVFLPGKSHRQRSLTGHSLWGRKDSDTTEQLTHTHTHTQRRGKKLLTPPVGREDTGRGLSSVNQEVYSRQNPPCWGPNPALPASRTLRNSYLLFKPLISSDFLQQPQGLRQGYPSRLSEQCSFFKINFYGTAALHCVLVSAAQGNESATCIYISIYPYIYICMYISPPPWISFPFRSPQSTEESYIWCYSVGSH